MRQQWPAGEAPKEALRQHHVDWKTPSMHGFVQDVEPKRKPPPDPPTGIPQPDGKRARQLKSDVFQTLSSAARAVDVIDQNCSFPLEVSRAGFLASVGQELFQNSG